MQISRTINVLTLAALLLLTGCLGITPPAEGEEASNAIVNNPPTVFISEALNELSLENGTNPTYNSSSGELTGFEVQVYHAAMDVDGDALTMGWDLDLDGQIDVATTQSSGFTSLDIPLSMLNELDAFDYEGYYHAVLAFIAMDEHGLAGTAITEVFLLEAEEDDTSVELRVMSGSDAGSSGDLSTDADDALIRIDFDSGSEVNWGYVNVQITVEGILEPMNCGNSLEAATEGNLKCYLVEFGNTADQLWTAGDGAMLYENGQDLCSAACEIDVKITNSQTDDPLAPGFTAEAE